MFKKTIAMLLAVLLVLAAAPMALAEDAPDNASESQLWVIPLTDRDPEGKPHLGEGATPATQLTVKTGEDTDVVFATGSDVEHLTYVEPKDLTAPDGFSLDALAEKLPYDTVNGDAKAVYYVRLMATRPAKYTITSGELSLEITAEGKGGPTVDPGDQPQDPNDPSEHQLHFTWLNNWQEGRPTLPEEIRLDLHMSICPGQAFEMAFFIRGENGILSVPVSELEFSEGVHAMPLAEEFEYPEDDLNAVSYLRLTVDDFRKEYTVSYGEYEMTFDSFMPSPALMSDPVFSEENFVDNIYLNPLDTQKKFYLMDACEYNGWDAARDSIVSIALQPHLEIYPPQDGNDKVELKRSLNGSYSIGLKDGVELERDGFNVVLDVKYADGRTEDRQIHVEPRATLAYADELITENDAPLSKYIDKLSTTLNMKPGETKDIFIYYVDCSFGDKNFEDWRLFKCSPDQYGTDGAEDAFKLEDHPELNWPTPSEGYISWPTFTVTALKDGCYSIFGGDTDITLIDPETGENIGGTVIEKMARDNGLGEYWDSEDHAVSLQCFKDHVEFMVDHDPENIVKVDWPEGTLYRPAYYRWDWLDSITVNVSNGFTDVRATDYFAAPVNWAVEKKVTSGTGNGTTFSPNAACTRAQIAAFIWNAAGKPEPKSTENPFIDVKESDWYYKAVLWAVENGITSGAGDGATFSPNTACTRGQAVTFLHRACGLPEAAAKASFTDVESGAYYENAVNWAVEYKITSGTGDGATFSPDAVCPRAQIATFLYRAV